MKPNTVTFEKAAQKIIAKEFAAVIEVLGANVVKSAYLPENDPGGWAPTSLLIVNHENGIPGKMDYEGDWHANWERIEQALSDALGFPVFFEPINGAVSALYRA